jgi:hypothetical protein
MPGHDIETMPSGNARKRTRQETEALIEAGRKRSEGAEKREFDYPFEDRGGSPLEDMLSPEQRGHSWRGAVLESQTLRLNNSSIDYFASDTESPSLSRADRLSLAVTYYGLSHKTEDALMKLTGATRFDTESLEKLDGILGPDSKMRAEVFGVTESGVPKSFSDLSIIDKVVIKDMFRRDAYSDGVMECIVKNGLCRFDVKGAEEALAKVRDLDEDDPVRLEVEGACGRDYPEHDVLDADGMQMPAFEEIEWAGKEALVADFRVCSAPRGRFWGDDGVELDRKVWAKDFQTNRSIVGLVKEGPYGYGYRVFVPTAYSMNTHAASGSAVKGMLVAEGVCETAAEAMCRASYYIEKCAIIPLSDAKKHGFSTNETMTKKTWEVLAVSEADASYIDTAKAQKRAAFRALPEEERKRRTAYAKSMDAKKGVLPKRGSVRDEVSSRISGGRRAKSLDERGARAERSSSDDSRAQAASRTGKNTEKSGGGHR